MKIHFLLFLSFFSIRLCAFEAEKKLQASALREKLYKFPSADDMKIHVNHYLGEIPKGTIVITYIFKQFSETVKNSWDIDLLIDELTDKMATFSRPPLSNADKNKYEIIIKNVLMSIAKKLY